jgi:hypothetical protein
VSVTHLAISGSTRKPDTEFDMIHPKVTTRALGVAMLAMALATGPAEAAPKARSLQVSMVQAYYPGSGGCSFPLFHHPPISYPACPPIPMSARDTSRSAISFGPIGVFNVRFDASGKDVKLSYFAKDVLNFGSPLSGLLHLSLDLSLTGNKCGFPDYTAPCTVVPRTIVLQIPCDAGICKGKTTLNTEMRKRAQPDLIVPKSDTRLEIQNVSVLDLEGDVAFYQGLLVR